KLQHYHKKSDEHMEKTEAYECLHQNDPLPNLIEPHKLGTPLRPIVSELKHPTTEISKFLDGLLRPLFDGMASNTTVTSGTEVIKLLQERSKRNIRHETLLCTIDLMDLYTMLPQTEGCLSI
ncbi:unnamed protein product, partial [Rotaria magnacalcarata]